MKLSGFFPDFYHCRFLSEDEFYFLFLLYFSEFSKAKNKVQMNSFSGWNLHLFQLFLCSLIARTDERMNATAVSQNLNLDRF